MQHTLTLTQRLAAHLNISRNLADLLLLAEGCGEMVEQDALTLVAVLEIQTLLKSTTTREEQGRARYADEEYAHELGDHFTRLNLFTAWQGLRQERSDAQFARRTFLDWHTCCEIERRVMRLKTMWPVPRSTDRESSPTNVSRIVISSTLD
ncbi:hypothetical protein BCR39DRAFT_504212 [Naematelia encephala]|uniref:Helicase-associated domain-containing protein n=1 Tax=Naematelia encephala TaxID=71784 RepID=A0A1Y2BFP4_9TREE|nr:hypothetical protein BCR39DRAFT_504212 [Naematelia encephala]